jgi:hypothetical protein
MRNEIENEDGGLWERGKARRGELAIGKRGIAKFVIIPSETRGLLLREFINYMHQLASFKTPRTRLAVPYPIKLPEQMFSSFRNKVNKNTQGLYIKLFPTLGSQQDHLSDNLHWYQVAWYLYGNTW